MAVQHGIWKIGEKPMVVKQIKLDTEQLLEEQIVHDISILNANWLLIGRQVRTDFGKYIDLLALDANGSVIIIELKRDKTPREVVAQALDYASWVVGIEAGKLVDIYQDLNEKKSDSLENAFKQKFGSSLSDVELNASHQMLVVAAELDASTERIINYLNDHTAAPINAVFFTVFQDGENQYLSRSWMIPPEETEQNAVNSGAKEPWNGEYYVSFGHGANHASRRHWDDAHKYGYISAGGRQWFSKTLNLLNAGDRVWANIPKLGYVGVGRVIAPAMKASEFKVANGKRLVEVSELIDYSRFDNESDDDTEYLVPVKWDKALPIEEAFSEVGLFGNQNSVCQPKTPKWQHTVQRLKTVWGVI